jgi:FKBP-type peptidyl-prolyl cis-trans isomerase SlyD
MKIEKDKVVSLEYVLRDAKGHVIQSTEEGNPSNYLHGHSNLIPALESELENKLAGDELKIEISPENGYGLWNERKIQIVSREKLSQYPDIKVGEQLFVQREGQKTHVMVIDVNDKSVTFDANHPLAGKVLFYEVKIAAVRDATSEEITNHKPHKTDGGSGDKR